MNKRNQTRPKLRNKKQTQSGSMSFRTYSLLFICILMLVSGFFFAARQHFSSMDFGMKNSRLRKQVDELEAEKRRLLLAREISLSPAEIKKAAKKAGIVDQPGNGGEIAQVVSATKEKALPSGAPESKPMVIKTASVSAVPPTIVSAIAKRDKAKPQKPKTVAE
jgi:hypothetical protein